MNWSLQDHIRCGEDIRRVFSLHGWYIDEFHKKKTTKKITKYYANDKSDDRFYKKHLFYKKNMLTSFHTFPTAFRYAMEEIMFICFSKEIDCTFDIYRGTDIEYSGNPLSDQSTLSRNDKRIILLYNIKYVALMQKCIKQIELCLPKHCDLIKMKKWCRHVESLDKWNVVRKLVKRIRHKQLVMYWFEISQQKHLTQIIQEDFDSMMQD